MRHVNSMLAKDFKSTFLSCEKDLEAIIKKLFIDSKPYSDYLKRLLVINTKDCLDDNLYQYQTDINNTSVADLIEQGYIRTVPKLSFGEHEPVKSYIIIEFDTTAPSSNPEFRNNVISFMIISHLDYWPLENYQLRPYKIAGYIDGILDGTKLSGIGTLQFLGANNIVLNEYLGGIVLRYVATHGSDDEMQNGEED